jgi:hypothetical protein
MSEPLTFGVEVEQREGFEFRVRFDWPQVPELVLDEPEPLGKARGPNAARLTESVRRGIPVAVTVVDVLGKVVHETTSPEATE